MSQAQQNEIEALKARVAQLEDQIVAKVKQAGADVIVDWRKLVERVEAMETQLRAFGAKVRK